jgi:hypothetical protein
MIQKIPAGNVLESTLSPLPQNHLLFSSNDISAASAQRLCMYHTQGTDDSKDSGALKQAAPAAESSKSI